MLSASTQRFRLQQALVLLVATQMIGEWTEYHHYVHCNTPELKVYEESPDEMCVTGISTENPVSCIAYSRSIN